MLYHGMNFAAGGPHVTQQEQLVARRVQQLNVMWSLLQKSLHSSCAVSAGAADVPSNNKVLCLQAFGRLFVSLQKCLVIYGNGSTTTGGVGGVDDGGDDGGTLELRDALHYTEAVAAPTGNGFTYFARMMLDILERQQYRIDKDKRLFAEMATRIGAEQEQRVAAQEAFKTKSAAAAAATRDGGGGGERGEEEGGGGERGGGGGGGGESEGYSPGSSVQKIERSNRRAQRQYFKEARQEQLQLQIEQQMVPSPTLLRTSNYPYRSPQGKQQQARSRDGAGSGAVGGGATSPTKAELSEQQRLYLQQQQQHQPRQQSTAQDDHQYDDPAVAEFARRYAEKKQLAKDKSVSFVIMIGSVSFF